MFLSFKNLHVKYRKRELTARKTYDITKREVNWDPPSHKSIKDTTIEYNKRKFRYNELLRITNMEKSENNTNLPNNSKPKFVGCNDNTEVKTNLTKN